MASATRTLAIGYLLSLAIVALTSAGARWYLDDSQNLIAEAAQQCSDVACHH